MIYPPFNDPGHESYDLVSIEAASLPKPLGCYVYTPDNYDDYQCLSIWQPAPELGARTWTRNGQRILIGVYRDEGREVIPGPEPEYPYETRAVFRLLPSFRVIPVAEVLAIIADANPELSREIVTLTSIQTGDVQRATEIMTRTTDVINRNHRQQLNELQRPLRQVYDAKGNVIPPDMRFSKNDNAKLHLTVPMVNQHDPIPSSNSALPAYDFYGFPLNDPSRGPFYRTDIVGYDEDEADGIARYENNGTPVYSGPIHDVFGDFVVGARANKTLITRKPVQPILVDHHNTPLKAPIRRNDGR